jgi:hypothetical protein
VEPPDQNWRLVSTNETLKAGTVLWLHAATNIMLALTGTYSDPTNELITAGSSFLPSAGLECRKLPGVEAGLACASFDPFSQFWQLHQPSVPIFDPRIPEVLAPGHALFINTAAAVEIECLTLLYACGTTTRITWVRPVP